MAELFDIADPAYSGESAAMALPLRVVIVTYNSAAALPGLLESLTDGLAGIPRSEVVVVDNGSMDGSVAIARAHARPVRVVETGRNGGYAAGVNIGCRDMPAEADLLVLNPDIRLHGGAVRLLVARLRDPAIGIAAPLVLHEDMSLSPSLRREPTLFTAWADALLFGRLAARLDWGETIRRPARYDHDGRVDWASGAVLAIAARARAAAGPWDESFFLYSEEVDYQRRVRAAGLAVAFVAGAVVEHAGGDYRHNTRLYALLTANRIRDYARRHGVVANTLFRLAVATGEALRSLTGSPVHRAGLMTALKTSYLD